MKNRFFQDSHFCIGRIFLDSETGLRNVIVGSPGPRIELKIQRLPITL